MYKTIWIVTVDNDKVQLTYYHFGKSPKFPTWYFEDNHYYTVEMAFNLKLRNTIKLFMDCLIKSYKIS